MFVAAEPGEGTSTLARAYALEVARAATRPVWLIELDLLLGAQHEQFLAAPDTYGRLGDPVRSSPDQSMFFTVQPPLHPAFGAVDDGFLAAYPVGRSRLYVTRFRRERLSPGQSVHILSEGAYWEALAAKSEQVIVDAPAWSRSRAAAAVAPFMDANLLVVSAERRNPEAASAVLAGVEAAGGRWAGVVANRAPKPPPRLLRVLAP
jgi:Mrp family chromosome partitioning ATPase